MKRAFKVVLLLCLLVTCTLALAPVAGALPHRGLALAADETAAPAPVPVSGGWKIWGIEGPATEPDPAGTVYIWGHEHGIWSGSFEGTSYEPYTGWVRADGYVWAIITVKFTGRCNGIPGKFTMQLTVEEPPGGDVYGQWAIISGSRGLRDLRGAGTWLLTDADDVYVYADYEGFVWEQ